MAESRKNKGNYNFYTFCDPEQNSVTDNRGKMQKTEMDE